MSDQRGGPVPADELVDQLRKRALGATRLRRWRSAQLMSQAADEIERLRKAYDQLYSQLDKIHEDGFRQGLGG